MVIGSCWKNAMISASNNLYNFKESINALNIFPVPDGDTGTNMSMTISAVYDNLCDNEHLGTISRSIASDMLKSARGNSGVILSVLFKGIAETFENQEQADGSALIKALGCGVDKAYEAVANPTEGTMLTVARMAFEEANSMQDKKDDPVEVWCKVCEGARKALDLTPDLLPVLKKANVVDAGGTGLCLVFEGMLSVFQNSKIIEKVESKNNTPVKRSDSLFGDMADKLDAEINFTYCTEVIISNDKERNQALSLSDFKTYLSGIGDSIVLIEDQDIVKLHVHTEAPGLVLQKALKIGSLLKIKIENMKEQNRIALGKEKSSNPTDDKLIFTEPTGKYGIITVASGNGVKDLFIDLGCSLVVNGGQTMNPSTNDIVSAIKATPAKTVFVLPNNKNIIMAAQQAVPLVSDRKVIVIPTKTIPQGIASVMAFNPDEDSSMNQKNMKDAIKSVTSGQVTFAARKSEYGGFKIKDGDILCLKNGKLIYIEKDPVKACFKLVRSMVKKDSSFVTVLYGNGITDTQANHVADLIKSKIKNKNIELNVIDGGQPVYYFIVSVE